MGNQRKRRESGKDKVKDPYSEEVIRKKRVLPTGDIIGLCVTVALQIAALMVILFFRPIPQDIIRDYVVTVEPQEDGTLEIRYDFSWTAWDAMEALTWVEIGMPHPDYVLRSASLSDTVESHEYYADGDYCSHIFYFKEAYIGGETVDFGFTIEIPRMLTQTEDHYVYEFVPGWFNEIPVEH